MKRIFFYVVLFFCFIFFLELFSYTATFFLQKKGFFYLPSKITRNEYKNYLNGRDEILGWPSPKTFKEYGFDKSGSRFTPAFPHPEKYPSYVSLYGDSFTYGTGVEHKYAYGNVLSILLKRRVANYGVGGYGTDQAYLRFCENTNDVSSIVILGVTTENIFRNVTRYLALLYSVDQNKFAFKPRFIINEYGQLQLIPLLKLSNYKECLAVINFPEKYFDHDYFVPGGPSGISKRTFPYTLTLIKIITRNERFKSKINGMPWQGQLYKITHPSNGLAITFSIITEFCKEAERRNKNPIVLIIPLERDFNYYVRNKKWTYENLIGLLRQNKVPFIDAGPEMLKYFNGRSPHEVLYNKNDKLHYSIEGYKILATVVYNYLKNTKIEVR